MDRLITRKQAAEFLGVTVQTMERWHATRTYVIEFIRVGGAIRYRTSEIEKLKRAREQEPPGLD